MFLSRGKVFRKGEEKRRSPAWRETNQNSREPK